MLKMYKNKLLKKKEKDKLLKKKSTAAEIKYIILVCSHQTFFKVMYLPQSLLHFLLFSWKGKSAKQSNILKSIYEESNS